MSQARLNRSNLRILGIIQQPVYQAGIQAIVKKMHCTFIGAPTNVPDALKLLRVHQPCIVLLDTLCDQIDVLMAMRLIRKRFPEAPVILLLLEERDEWLVQAMRVGVAACLARDVDEETLKESIQRVGQGEYPIENTVLTRPRLVSYLRRMICEPDTDESGKPSMSPCLLTQREKTILEYMAQGWENKRIARELKLHYQTVKNHITAILSKLDVHDRTAAVVTALKQHWIALPDNVRRSN